MSIYKQMVVNVIKDHSCVDEVLVFEKDENPALLDLVAFKLLVVVDKAKQWGYLELKQCLEKLTGRQVDIVRVFDRISGRNLLDPESVGANRLVEYRIRWE